MTVDSQYKPKEFKPDDDTEFVFDIESFGDEAMRAFVIVEGFPFPLQVVEPD